MKKIVHIITGLGDGGAEASLFNLCKVTQKSKRVENYVISLLPGGKYKRLLEGIGINVLELNFSKQPIHCFCVLTKVLKEMDIDVVQTWMYHADFIGGLAAKLAKKKNIVWGVHNTVLELDKSKLTTVIISRINSILSYVIPKKIIYCAESSRKVHEKLYYKRSVGVVINNGYDLERFSNDVVIPEDLNKYRQKEDQIIFGMVGRYDKFKDHNNLFRAISLVKKVRHNFKVILIGNGINSENKDIVNQINEQEVNDEIILLGQRDDIPSIMNFIDVHILSSSAEAFPNVICEAMAVGTPCLSTDVGDASIIIGDNGWIVPSKSPQKLANAIVKIIVEIEENNDIFLNRKKTCMSKIKDNYSIESSSEKYINLWEFH
ncbi:glycosyltransferase [Vibrio parahaemolyticus]|nr:glycosyltransferase [Vibrio parahaemolyticus]